jgi:hypothetical protein
MYLAEIVKAAPPTFCGVQAVHSKEPAVTCRRLRGTHSSLYQSRPSAHEPLHEGPVSVCRDVLFVVLHEWQSNIPQAIGAENDL